MRDAIRTALKNAVTELLEVYQPFMAGPSTHKPYATVKFGVDIPGPVKKTGEQSVIIGVYLDREDYAEVDAIYAKVLTALAGELITDSGFRFSLDYRGSVGEDFYDTAFQAIGRMARFAIAYVS